MCLAVFLLSALCVCLSSLSVSLSHIHVLRSASLSRAFSIPLYHSRSLYVCSIHLYQSVCPSVVCLTLSPLYLSVSVSLYVSLSLSSLSACLSLLSIRLSLSLTLAVFFICLSLSSIYLPASIPDFFSVSPLSAHCPGRTTRLKKSSVLTVSANVRP